MSIQGKTAIVTGSTSGIGLGMAKSLASKGAYILLNGFGNADQIAETAAFLCTDVTENITGTSISLDGG